MDATIEDECHNLLSQATMQLFSNLFHVDANLDFDKVMNPILAELHDGLEKEVRDHMADFVPRFTNVSEGSDEDVDIIGNGEGTCDNSLSA